MEKGNHENNQVMLKGKVVEEPVYSHSLYGEKFFSMMLEVPRLSGVTDVLPVMVSDRLLRLMDVSLGDELAVIGQLRSYNRLVEGKSRLILTVLRATYLRRRTSPTTQTRCCWRAMSAARRSTAPRRSAAKSPTC